MPPPCPSKFRNSKQGPYYKVRQGNITCPKLVTNETEDMFKILNWTGRSININAEYIYQLLFVIDIDIMVETL